MSKRARRLAKALENMGWVVFSNRTDCPGCGDVCFGNKFCCNCGTKQPKPSQKSTLEDLEQALVFACDDHMNDGS